jgi:hypothetical protein
MRFENVYGNSSLLTTVGDLLKWNENLDNPKVGGARLVSELSTQGRLTSGRQISYALGLVVDNYFGIREVSHSGGTAGYRAYLTRYPEQKLSAAVLCNMASSNPVTLTARVADVFLVKKASAAPPVAVQVSLPVAQQLSGPAAYRNRSTGVPTRFVVRNGVLRFERGGPLNPAGGNAFTFNGGRLEFSPDWRTALLLSNDGDTATLVREPEWTPTRAELESYVGTFSSDESESAFSIRLEDGGLVITDQYGRSRGLTPYYKDGFLSEQGWLVVFRRGATGAVNAASLGLGRVRDLRFVKK